MYEVKEEHYKRYLRLLGIEKEKPDYKYLQKIIHAHLSKIPFENISKLYYKKRYGYKELIDFQLYLDGIEKFGFGGTCYSINSYLNLLLQWLGFEVKLCGADMKKPNVHVMNIVNIEKREFIVDLGYAAPFSVPLPLGLRNDYVLTMGIDKYILKTQSPNNSPGIELYRNGELRHGYQVNTRARMISDFKKVIEDSFNKDATFMNALLLTRYDGKKFIVVHNMTLLKSFGEITETYEIRSIEQLASIINNYFGIPKPMVIESIEGIQLQKNGWS